MAHSIYNNPDVEAPIIGHSIITCWFPGKYLSVLTSKSDPELAKIWGWDPWSTTVTRCNKWGMMVGKINFLDPKLPLYEKFYSSLEEALQGHQFAVNKFS